MKKIGFVGAGNMATALIRGMLDAGQHGAADMWASDPDDAQLRRLKRAHKIEVTRDNRELVRRSHTVILAVKPQVMAALLDEVRPEVNPRKLSFRSQPGSRCVGSRRASADRRASSA